MEVLQAQISRCELVESHINAFIDCYFDEALQQAKAAEQRYQSGTARPIEGITVAVKDEFKLKGTRRTSASLVYENRIDDETDVLIQRLLDAGAIVHGKTTTPEFCLLGSCHSRLLGQTHNPWNLDITPGGSSGGSGAALAAGTTTLATGSDIGGSIRIPASLCGVIGYKPPYGRNPEPSVFGLDFYSHSGPMTRSVEDIALMQNIMSGPHNCDVASLRERVIIDTDRQFDISRWRVAYSMDLGFMEIDNSVKQNTLRALDVFRSLGAQVEEVQLGWDESIINAVHHYWAHGWAATMANLLSEYRKDLCDYTIWFVENSIRSAPQDYIDSLQTTVDMYAQFGPLVDHYDVFICPTLMTSSVPVDASWPESIIEINGEERRVSEEHWSATFPFNMLSRCPVISLPSGLASNGVPTGIQLVARTYDDQRVFDAALGYIKNIEPLSFELDPRITNKA